MLRRYVISTGRIVNMPGTRTAPTVDGLGATFIGVSLRWIDYTSDLRTDTYKFAPTTTAAQIESFCAAMQAVSNASLYEIKVSDTYVSIGDGSNALEDVWENVSDNLVIQAKEPGGISLRVFCPSPIEGMFIDGTNEIDPTNGALAALLTAWTACIDVSYEVVGARFTSRRQINQQVKI